MISNASATWFHSNQYHAQKACEHCNGVVRHESWCITRDALVQYAYGVVVNPETMTLTDRLILHALGASWVENKCEGTCRKNPQR